MSRTPLIAANWKMNPPPEGWSEDGSPYRSRGGVEVVAFPTFLDLAVCAEAGLLTGAQYGRPEATGAFTGDISMQMIAMQGATYVLCGHSERRNHHGETDDDVALQVAAAIEAGLLPVVCVGETAKERERGEAKKIVERQVRAVPAPHAFAYEPVWAIGSEKAASPEDAQEMHAFIRSLLSAGIRDAVRILYGGSAKPGNAGAFLSQNDVDGLLVGGASLHPAAFGAMVDVAAD